MEWELLSLNPAPASERVLAEILDVGQAFRWRQGGPAGRRAVTWCGAWADCTAEVRWHPEGIEWRSPVGASLAGTRVRHYFDADRDYAGVTDMLPWRSDPHLARCLEEFRGLRLLR